MNLTRHFTLDEFVASRAAVRHNIDNTPSIQIVHNLTLLAETLERVRALAGKPLTITSGYRCPALNQLVGGAPTSAHTLGLAADITCTGMPPKVLAQMIRDSDIVFDQLIYEGTWVHVGLSVDAPRRDVLTAHFDDGRTTYTEGIA